MLGPLELLVVAAAAVAAGAVNAVAGGGTLISFPVLVAVGLPVVTANMTNAVGLCPGSFTAALAQKEQFAGQAPLLWKLMPVSILGGLLGGALLLATDEKSFRAIVPYLLLLATLTLALQDRVRGWLLRRAERRGFTAGHQSWAPVLVGTASVYGGYFGAGLGIITLAALGAVLDDSLTRLNAVKSLIALVVNVAAAVFFVFSGQIVWSAAAVMALGSLVGGVLGGRLAQHISAERLRWTIVAVGLVLSVVYFVR